MMTTNASWWLPSSYPNQGCQRWRDPHRGPCITFGTQDIQWDGLTIYMCKEVRVDEYNPYLIVRNNEANKVLHKHCRREWWDVGITLFVHVFVMCRTISLGQQLVAPAFLYNFLVILCGVCIVEMVAEVRGPGGFLVKIVRYVLRDFIPLDAICFAARLLEGGVFN